MSSGVTFAEDVVGQQHAKPREGSVDAVSNVDAVGDDVDVDHAMELEAMEQEASDATLAELLRSLDDEQQYMVRTAGQQDPSNAIALLMELLPHEADNIHNLVSLSQNVFYTFLFEGSLPTETFRRDMGMSCAAPSVMVPSALVDMLRLTHEDVQRISDICTILGSQPVSVAPVYVECGRDVDATYNALQ